MDEQPVGKIDGRINERLEASIASLCLRRLIRTVQSRLEVCNP